MMPSAYCGYDGQSDAQAAMLLNPWHTVHIQPDAVNAADASIPWCLRGALLTNCVLSLLQSAVMHRKLSLETRLENALCTHILLDLGRMMSLEREKDLGVKRGSLFFDSATIRNLKNLVGCVAIVAASLPDGYAFKPWKMCELPLEWHFGMLRGQYTSAQMSVRDFIQADAILGAKTVRKQSKVGQEAVLQLSEFEAMGLPQKRLSEEQFQAAATRAMKAAFELMERCSTMTKVQIHKAYMAYRAGRQSEESDEDCQREGRIHTKIWDLSHRK